MTMDKNNKKRNSYNPVVIDHLVKKYGFSKSYIRQCIDGTKKGISCDTIKKDYYAQVAAVQSVLQ